MNDIDDKNTCFEAQLRKTFAAAARMNEWMSAE